MTRRFGITFDYLCPFARNAHELVAAGIEAGADWDVDFVPYSLVQGHVEEGDPDVWDRDDPYAESGILAFMAGLAIRDRWPERFLAAHRELFAARHDHGQDIKDERVVRAALERADLPVNDVWSVVEEGDPLEVLHKEHTRAVRDHDVWGVPTFMTDQRAVFVRLMERADGDLDHAERTIERVLELVTDFTALHEFKQTDKPV